MHRCKLLACLLSLPTLIAQDVQPARFSSGSVPLPPPQTVGWLEAVLQVSVSAAGTVAVIETLRATEPLAGMLTAAVKRWTFQPALENSDAVASHVLVAAVYRPATLFNPPRSEAPPVDLAQLAEGFPFPTFTTPPAYPPTALGDGVLLVEVLVDADGKVRTATVLRSSGAAFDSSAIRAAVSWRFRPGRRGNVPTPALAYLVLGFRRPVVSIAPR